MAQSKSIIGSKMLYLLCILIVFIANISECRKSYIIKEKIVNGDLKVRQPRVKATISEWCWFKDANNDWCVTGEQEIKAEIAHEYDYQSGTKNEIPSNFNHITTYKTTMKSTWINNFNLKRLMT